MENKSNEAVVRSKEVFYRGQPLETLKGLEVRELAKYFPSRARRYTLRNFHVIENFIKKCEIFTAKKKKIKTHGREMVIVPKFVGLTISVYNGKTFNDVHVTGEMIGHRLGEFSPTTGKVAHSEAGIGATKSSRALKK